LSVLTAFGAETDCSAPKGDPIFADRHGFFNEQK
jgi:hypothetical protein